MEYKERETREQLEEQKALTAGLDNAKNKGRKLEEVRIYKHVSPCALGWKETEEKKNGSAEKLHKASPRAIGDLWPNTTDCSGVARGGKRGNCPPIFSRRTRWG